MKYLLKMITKNIAEPNPINEIYNINCLTYLIKGSLQPPGKIAVQAVVVELQQLIGIEPD